MIIWITGNSGSGKTTLAKKLIEDRNMILLDREIDYYASIDDLKEMHISNGYENLAWFR